MKIKYHLIFAPKFSNAPLRGKDFFSFFLFHSYMSLGGVWEGGGWGLKQGFPTCGTRTTGGT
jgi:hypothetical protein